MSVLEDFEVEMAPGGGSCGSHARNDLTNADPVALVDSHRLQVVISSNDPVAMVDFHPVATAPWMPSCGADHA
jgi:hypothetical protein